MKNIIALFSLLLFFPATAQEYVPMLEVGKIWNMEWHSDFGTFIPYTIEITETVQINNIIYYKLVQSPVYNCSILLREKISEKKIYRLINKRRCINV